MDVGIELRAARERRGLSLGHISHTTKISLPVLQAIEAADERRLPAKVFTRSFVKTYAALVGLDPDETTRRYLEQLTPPPPADPAVLDSDSATPAPAQTPVRPRARRRDTRPASGARAARPLHDRRRAVPRRHLCCRAWDEAVSPRSCGQP